MDKKTSVDCAREPGVRTYGREGRYRRTCPEAKRVYGGGREKGNKLVNRGKMGKR